MSSSSRVRFRLLSPFAEYGPLREEPFPVTAAAPPPEPRTTKATLPTAFLILLGKCQAPRQLIECETECIDEMRFLQLPHRFDLPTREAIEQNHERRAVVSRPEAFLQVRRLPASAKVPVPIQPA